MKKKYPYLEWIWFLTALLVYGISLIIPFLILEYFYNQYGLLIFALIFPLCMYLNLFFLILISGLLRQLLPDVKQGVFRLNDKKEVTNWLLHTGIVNYIMVPKLDNLIRSNPLLKSLYYKLMGAKIHRTAMISYDVKIIDPFLVEIGEGTKIGRWAKIAGHYADENNYIIGKVKVGKNAIIGGFCFLAPNSSIGDSSILLAKSYTLPGMNIPPGEVWGGNPARFKKKRDDNEKS